MDKERIIETIAPTLDPMGCFLVEVTVSKDNDVEIVIEKSEGLVSWDDCVAIDRIVHENFSQDEEDYSLTVSSAGLDRPFKVPAQFEKAMGSMVDVRFKGGKRLKEQLLGFDGESVTLSSGAYPLSGINSVRPYIEIK